LKSSAKATDANQRIRKARIFILFSPRKTARDTIFAGLQSVIQDKTKQPVRRFKTLAAFDLKA